MSRRIPQSFDAVGLSRRQLVLAAAASAFAGGARSANFPQRSIEVIVPFAPGGVTDASSRLVAEQMARRLGQPLPIKNVAGAGGHIGFLELARSKPDGYTLGLIGSGTITTPLIQPNAGYHARQDFRPLGFIGEQAFVLMVHPSFGPRNLKAALDLVSKHPGEFAYSSGGNGAPSHALMELMKFTTSSNILHVPYKGQSPAVTALLAGEVQLSMQTITGSEELLHSGKLIPLAVTGKSRMATLPAVPTFAEAGVPGIDGTGWMSFAVPRQTPDAVTAVLADAFQASIRDVGLIKSLTDRSVKPNAMSPSEVDAYMAADMAFWQRAFTAAGIKL